MNANQPPDDPRRPRTKYVVFVDDNYHFMDESERYKLGEYASQEEAVEAVRKIVDEFLAANYQPGMQPETLWNAFTLYGEDPWISSVEFSAWDYAKKRCYEICGV